METGKHVVRYTESERGWGGEVWFSGFDNLESAKIAIEECNKDLPESTPDYYIKASYEGFLPEIPKGWKF